MPRGIRFAIGDTFPVLTMASENRVRTDSLSDPLQHD